MMTLAVLLSVLWVIASMRIADAVQLGIADVDSADPMGRPNITKKEFKEIPAHLIDPHPDNPRDPSVFTSSHPAYQALKALFVAAKGWIPGNNAVVRPSPFTSGRYQTLKAHRRIQVATKEMGITTIPCEILYGLSDSDALSIVMDQQTGLALDKAEKLRALRSLLQRGFKRARAMAQLSLTANDMVAMLRVLSLPEAVQQDWKRYVADKSDKKIVINPIGDNLKKLESAAALDAANDWDGLVEEGPHYQETYQSLVEAKNKPKSPSDIGIYKEADIKALIKFCHKRHLLRLLKRLIGLLPDPMDEIMAKLEYAHDVTTAVANGETPPTALLDAFRTARKPAKATAPETTAPETTGPETTGPETTGPETTGPETTGPETTGPETTGPETTGPETTDVSPVVQRAMENSKKRVSRHR